MSISGRSGWLAVLVAAAVQAAPEQQASTKEQRAGPEETGVQRTERGNTVVLEGVISAYYPELNRFYLEGSDRPLHLDESTQVTLAGEPATLENVRPGQRVRVTYSGADTLRFVGTLELDPRQARD